MISDPVKEVRTAASLALPVGWSTLRELYAPLLDQLKQVRSIQERSAIGWAIAGLPAPPVESIPDLIEALSLDNRVLKKTIPTALAKLGQTARPALPALARAAARELADPSTSALEAAQAIVTIDSESPEAQAVLLTVVADLRGSPMGFVRQQAAVVLAKYGPSAASAVEPLRRALTSGDTDVRQRAAFLLGTIGPASRLALEELTAMVRARSGPPYTAGGCQGDAADRRRMSLFAVKSRSYHNWRGQAGAGRFEDAGSVIQRLRLTDEVGSWALSG